MVLMVGNGTNTVGVVVLADLLAMCDALNRMEKCILKCSWITAFEWIVCA